MVWEADLAVSALLDPRDGELARSAT